MSLLRNTVFLKRAFYVLFLLKLLAVFFIPEERIKVFEDYSLAENLYNTGSFFYNHDGIDNHSFPFPIYPFLLYFSILISGLSLKTALLIQVLSIGFGSVLIVEFLYSFFDRKTSSLSSSSKEVLKIIILLFPFINYYAYFTAHTFAFNFFMLSLFMYVSERFLSGKSKWWLLAITFGLLLVQRSSLVVLVLFPLLDQLNMSAFQLKKWIAIFLLASVFPLSWSYRNYKVDDVFGMTSTTGKILWKGSIPQSSGSNYIEGNNNYYAYFPDSIKSSFNQLSVREQNEVFMDLYEENKKDRSAFVKGYWIKLKSFFMFREGMGTEHNSKTIIYAYQFYYVALILLVILALIKYKELLLPLILPFVFLGLFQAWFYVEMRHRIIYEPILIAIAFILVMQFSFKKSEKINA
jgi:hypothetical protein